MHHTSQHKTYFNILRVTNRILNISLVLPMLEFLYFFIIIAACLFTYSLCRQSKSFFVISGDQSVIEVFSSVSHGELDSCTGHSRVQMSCLLSAMRLVCCSYQIPLTFTIVFVILFWQLMGSTEAGPLGNVRKGVLVNIPSFNFSQN